MSRGIDTSLLAAIKIIRGRCDMAERYAKDDNIQAVQNVMHEIAWGYANATSRIEGALARAALDYDREIALLKRELEKP